MYTYSMEIENKLNNSALSLLTAYFTELINFREGFYRFSFFLLQRKMSHHLAFYVELWQFRRQLNIFETLSRTVQELNAANNAQGAHDTILHSSIRSNSTGKEKDKEKDEKEKKRKSMGLLGTQVDFDFLPTGDCIYLDRTNVVQQAWNIYIKYIALKNDIRSLARQQHTARI